MKSSGKSSQLSMMLPDLEPAAKEMLRANLKVPQKELPPKPTAEAERKAAEEAAEKEEIEKEERKLREQKIADQKKREKKAEQQRLQVEKLQKDRERRRSFQAKQEGVSVCGDDNNSIAPSVAGSDSDGSAMPPSRQNSKGEDISSKKKKKKDKKEKKEDDDGSGRGGSAPKTGQDNLVQLQYDPSAPLPVITPEELLRQGIETMIHIGVQQLSRASFTEDGVIDINTYFKGGEYKANAKATHDMAAKSLETYINQRSLDTARNEQLDMKALRSNNYRISPSIDLSSYLNSAPLHISLQTGRRIFKVFDVENEVEGAIKVENMNSNTAQELIHESKILMQLQAKDVNQKSSSRKNKSGHGSDDNLQSIGYGQAPGIPLLYGFGEQSPLNVCILELLGPNLQQLFEIQNHDKKARFFDTKTLILIAIQGLQALEYIHSLNIIHRALKPSVFCVGGLHNKFNRKLIYLTDYSCSKDLTPILKDMDDNINKLKEKKRRIEENLQVKRAAKDENQRQIDDLTAETGLSGAVGSEDFKYLSDPNDPRNWNNPIKDLPAEFDEEKPRSKRDLSSPPSGGSTATGRNYGNHAGGNLHPGGATHHPGASQNTGNKQGDNEAAEFSYTRKEHKPIDYDAPDSSSSGDDYAVANAKDRKKSTSKIQGKQLLFEGEEGIQKHDFELKHKRSLYKDKSILSWCELMPLDNTILFLNITGHRQVINMTPRDDLVALGLMLVYFTRTSGLPWEMLMKTPRQLAEDEDLDNASSIINRPGSRQAPEPAQQNASGKHQQGHGAQGRPVSRQRDKDDDDDDMLPPIGGNMSQERKLLPPGATTGSNPTNNKRDKDKKKDVKALLVKRRDPSENRSNDYGQDGVVEMPDNRQPRTKDQIQRRKERKAIEKMLCHMEMQKDHDLDAPEKLCVEMPPVVRDGYIAYLKYVYAGEKKNSGGVLKKDLKIKHVRRDKITFVLEEEQYHTNSQLVFDYNYMYALFVKIAENRRIDLENPVYCWNDEYRKPEEHYLKGDGKEKSNAKGGKSDEEPKKFMAAKKEFVLPDWIFEFRVKRLDEFHRKVLKLRDHQKEHAEMKNTLPAIVKTEAD